MEEGIKSAECISMDCDVAVQQYQVADGDSIWGESRTGEYEAAGRVGDQV